MAKSKPARDSSAAVIVWLAMLVFGLGAATIAGYHQLLSSNRAGRFAFTSNADTSSGIVRATSGASGDMANEHAKLLAAARPAVPPAR